MNCAITNTQSRWVSTPSNFKHGTERKERGFMRDGTFHCWFKKTSPVAKLILCYYEEERDREGECSKERLKRNEGGLMWKK